MKFNVTAGADYATYDNQTFLPKVNIYNPKTLTLATTMNAGGAKASNNREKTLYTTLFTSLAYNRVFAKDHDLTVMAIYSYADPGACRAMTRSAFTPTCQP